MKTKIKKICTVLTAAIAVAMTSVVAFADPGTTTGLGDHSDAIIAQFSGAASDIIPIILGILGVGLGIFVIFVGIKLAKKMFGTVATG
ncbi:MAG: hypothetical protein FWH05_09285 [Oscillospiraceae bacterium]|nr:hypothetical protein [Oscillospiraceae bacterium]